MRILISNFRFPRAAQISVNSRRSNRQIFANSSKVVVSDFTSHCFRNHDPAPAHQAATGQGVLFKLQSEETTLYCLKSRENLTAAACMETRNSFATPRMWHGRRSDEKSRCLSTSVGRRNSSANALQSRSSLSS